MEEEGKREGRKEGEREGSGRVRGMEEEGKEGGRLDIYLMVHLYFFQNSQILY